MKFYGNIDDISGNVNLYIYTSRFTRYNTFKGGIRMDKNVTIIQIAKECGVSIATVSRVINHSNAVSEKSYRRVMDAVRKFNYVPNSTARSLSTSTSTSIGVVIPDINNPFFSLLLEGITRVADERGYHVLLFNTAERSCRPCASTACAASSSRRSPSRTPRR